MEKIPHNDKANQDPMKVLGLVWLINDDILSLSKIMSIQQEPTLTKRIVLKQIASAFDPLGLFSPVILQGKLLLQTLWNKKISWDQMVPLEDEHRWVKIKTDLKKIPDCKIPRYIGMDIDNSPSYQLLVFCDASKYVYAAAVYLRQEREDKCVNNLIFLKTRLAPNKDMSIARLELLAAVIGIRCLNFVERELKLELKHKHVWLDSQCVLYWIGSKMVFSTFIENRLKEIR